MDFEISFKIDSIRLGKVTSRSLNGTTCLVDTPGCFIYARSGAVPHLTHSCLNEVLDGSMIWHMPLSSVIEQPGLGVMSKFGKSYAEFANVAEHVLCCSVHDSLCEKSGIYKYNEEKSVSVWAPGGRCKLTPSEYMHVVNEFGFDICLAISDQIQTENETSKRCGKSSERSVKFIDQCLISSSTVKKPVHIIGSLEGGGDLHQRERCAQEVSKRICSGYMLSGLEYHVVKWKHLAAACLKYLPIEKPRMMFGVFSPEEILHAVEMGVDIFDTVTPVDTTERGCALVFNFNLKKRRLEHAVASSKVLSSEHNLRNSDTCLDKSPQGVLVPVEDASNKTNNGLPVQVRKDLSKYEINLHDVAYIQDQEPLVQSCTCYCCRHHVKAYLHHLLVAKEMLGMVLLMMHNLHHWFEFFKELRSAIRENRFEEFKEIILAAI